MVFSNFFIKECYLAQYIYKFGLIIIFFCQNYYKKEILYIKIIKNSKHCASYIKGFYKYIIISWSIFKRQQQDLEIQLFYIKEEEDRTLWQMITYQQHLLEHYTQIFHIKHTFTLSKKHFKAKIFKKLY